MSKKTNGPDSIPRLIRLAFKYAYEGDHAKSLEFWRSAVDRGYDEKGKTERQLRRVLAGEITAPLKKGERPNL